MLIKKRRLIIITGVIIICGFILFSLLHLVPFQILPLQNKPEQVPQKVYDYYLILDEQDERTLMYVPLVAHVGDEVLTEDNKLYQIVRIEENRAYARFIRSIDLEKIKE
ncbi:hypothetical protein P22_3891 [Propionispora sp. 2/2-37]|uniref:stage II sporulation protein P n=1 Tax=Propionispora sp. 2/2-37 TaxID=1677858 RepID=UPI0006BED299|nr:stage II sporulation protein P [Propionispora sp. 2/2-37]CUH97747.1 hypothetical protein P22_3891 [Propionispora sp. 2/2-37]